MKLHIKPVNEPKFEVSIEEANDLLFRGDLDGDELAWKPGLTDWVTLAEIEGIKIPTPPPLSSDSPTQQDIEVLEDEISVDAPPSTG